MKKSVNVDIDVTNASEEKEKTIAKKRLVPALSESEKKLFAAIETSPAFGEEAFWARHAVLKDNS